jgi:hypothetical protein
MVEDRGTEDNVYIHDLEIFFDEFVPLLGCVLPLQLPLVFIFKRRSLVGRV